MLPLANNLREFSLLGVVTLLTKSFGINKLDRILYCNKGKWHKSCNLKYNARTFNRAEKRKNDSSILDSDTLSKSSDTRRKLLRCEVTSKVCFFCDSPATLMDAWHDAMTFQVDQRNEIVE